MAEDVGRKQFGTELWVILSCYMFCILAVALHSAVARFLPPRFGGTASAGADTGRHMVDHYLAGRNLGPVTLGFSVCASMFSGYTVVGLPAEAYTNGFSAWRWVGSCTFISIVYIAYSPRLQWLSRARGYDSILSFVRDRYGLTEQHKEPLHWLMVLVLLVPCFIYLCAQFDAFGNTISTLSDGEVSPLVGALGLAALISICEMLGGLQAVAMTDVIQGGVLLIGSMFILIFMDTAFGGLPAISKELELISPTHVTVMDGDQGLSWAEFWLGVGIQRALFPDYPQRAMAASSQNSLRMGNAILAVAPFVVQVPLLFYGIIGAVKHPGLENPKEVFSLVVLDIVHENSFGKIIGSIMMAASVAAIMSTADSVLIVVSQIITLDIVRPIRKAILANSEKKRQEVGGPDADGSPSPPAARVAALGQTASAATAATAPEASKDMDAILVYGSRLATLLAAFLCIPIVESDFDLSFLIQFQSSILAQTLPTLVVSLYWRGMHKWAAITGLVVGVSIGVGLVGNEIQGGILISLVANFVVTMTVACAFPKFANPVTAQHAQILRMVYWKHPSPLLYADQPNLPPPNRKEPINTWWGLGVLAIVLPWLALPLYRTSGTVDPYLSGSPLWAVSALVVLAAVHALIIYIIGCYWLGGKRSTTHGAGGDAAKDEEDSEEHKHGEVNPQDFNVGFESGHEAQIAALHNEVHGLRSEVSRLKEEQVKNVRVAMREELGSMFS